LRLIKDMKAIKHTSRLGFVKNMKKITRDHPVTTSYMSARKNSR